MQLLQNLKSSTCRIRMAYFGKKAVQQMTRLLIRLKIIHRH